MKSKGLKKNMIEFEKQLHEIVDQGLVPTVECTACGFKTCCFEGKVSLVQAIYEKPCEKCGGVNKFHGIESEL